MPDKKIIAATLSVDTGNSNANVKSLNTEINTTKKSLSDIGATAKSTSKDIEGSTGSFSNLKERIGSLPGPLGAAGEGVSKLSTAFKVLLLNPVVLVLAAIVAALTILYKAFTSTSDGAEKMEQLFSGVGAVIDVIRDRILRIAGAIGKFFSGDFKGALSDARAAVSGIGDEIAEEFQKAADATKRLQEVEDALRDLSEGRAKLNRDLREAKELINDDEASSAKRLKAIKEVGAAEEEQTTKELDNAKKKLQAIKDRNSLSENVTDEELKKASDAQVEIYQLEEKSASDRDRLNKQRHTILKKDEAERKAERAKAIEAQKAQQREFIEYTSKLTKLQQENELALIKDSYQKELTQLQFKIADEKKANEQAFKDKKLTKNQLDQLNQALDVQANLQANVVTDKHNEEVRTKQIAFEKELNTITQKTRLDGIRDTRELERVQLQIGYQEKLQDAINRYKDDAIKLQAIKTALDAQLKADQDKLDVKNAKEDAKKKFDATVKSSDGIINDPLASFKQKKAALQLEVQANQDAYDAKAITEDQYLENKKKNTATELSLNKARLASELDIAGKVGDALGSLSELVGKNTAAGKAFAVAQASISAIQGAINSFTSLSSIPIVGPALGAIAAAAALAAGIANVKKIIAVKVPGQGSGGGSAPTGLTAPLTPAAPVQNSTRIDQDSINKMGSAVQPVQAYVVESQGANTAERIARLNRAARLGG